MKNNMNIKTTKCIKCGIKTLKKYIVHSSTCINCDKIRNISIRTKDGINVTSNITNNRKGNFARNFSLKNINSSIPSFSKMYVFYIENHFISDYHNEYKKIEEIIEDIYGDKVEFIYNYSLNISHHIVFDDDRIGARSFEYIMSLVTGKYILSFEFLKQMTISVPQEKEFLLKGDSKFPTSMAPHKCLTGAHIDYLPRLKFYSHKKIFKGRVLRLLYTIGATYSVRKTNPKVNTNLTNKEGSNNVIRLFVHNTEELLDYFARWDWE